MWSLWHHVWCHNYANDVMTTQKFYIKASIIFQDIKGVQTASSTHLMSLMLSRVASSVFYSFYIFATRVLYFSSEIIRIADIFYQSFCSFDSLWGINNLAADLWHYKLFAAMTSELINLFYKRNISWSINKTLSKQLLVCPSTHMPHMNKTIKPHTLCNIWHPK